MTQWKQALARLPFARRNWLKWNASNGTVFPGFSGLAGPSPSRLMKNNETKWWLSICLQHPQLMLGWILQHLNKMTSK